MVASHGHYYLSTLYTDCMVAIHGYAGTGVASSAVFPQYLWYLWYLRGYRDIRSHQRVATGIYAAIREWLPG